ncbi:uncharacterized protein BDV17DRAFT_178495 [Aspergillus undulatus]|uniref:uncharacterized protein n=1 Tax=Aspergillus undulatus TaxID=1810928 RepID=UPI003CCDDF43
MDSLPKGLVSVSGKVSAELNGIGSDAVDVGDIVQLWKAYSTSPSAHQGDAGYRLQNFFWRLWSSKRLSNSLTGSTLARLFLQISEPTVTRPSLFKQSEPQTLSSSLKHDGKHQHPPGHPSSGGTTATTPKPPLQPILKKSNSSSHGETQKTTRLLLTGLSGQSVTRKPSNPPTPIPPSKPVTFGEQTLQGSRPSQKKTFAVGSKAKSAKRRPVMMRRKSSQQSSVSSTRNHSPQLVPSPPVTGALEVPIVQENETDEEAVINSPEEPLTITKVVNSPPDSPVPASTATSTLTTAATTNPPTHPSDQNPTLPPELLADLKTLLHKSTPVPAGPSLRQRSSQPAQPTVGFFSTTACRHFDVRHLSEENYEQPSTASLVEGGFRSRFVEQKRAAEEWYQRYREQYFEQYGYSEQQQKQSEELGSSGINLHSGSEAEENRPGTGTETEEIVSPTKSPYGDSHQSRSHGASTVATSILASTSSGSVGGGIGLDDHDIPVFSPGDAGLDLSPQPETQHQPGTSGAVAVPVPSGTVNPFLQTPSVLSVPRGPSGLSLLIGQSRNSLGQGAGMGMATRNTEDREQSYE